MTTKLKIIIGFVVMVILLGVVAILGYVELQRTVGGFVEYRRNARVDISSSDMEGYLFLAVAKTYDFVLTNDTKKLDDAIRLTDAFIKQGAEAESETQMDERVKLLKKLQQDAVIFKGRQEEVRTSTLALHHQYETEVRNNYTIMREKLRNIADIAYETGNASALLAISVVWEDFSRYLTTLGRLVQSGSEADSKEALERMATMTRSLEDLQRVLRTPQGNKAYQEAMVFHKNLENATALMVSNAKSRTDALNAMRSIESGLSTMISNLSDDAAKMRQDVGDRVLAESDLAQKTMIALSVVGVLAGAIIAVLIVFSIMRVLGELARFANNVAEGNFGYVMKSREKGEIGAVINAMKNIPEVLLKIVEASREQSVAVSSGKLRSRGDASVLPGTFSELGHAFNAMSDAYTAIIDALPMPVMAGDKNCNVVFLNPAGQVLAEGEYMNRPCKDVVNSELCGTKNCLGKNCMSSQSSIIEETTLTAHGKRMDISFSSTPLRGASGEVTGYIEVLTDLTDVRHQQRVMMGVAEQASDISSRVAAASEELSAQVEQVSRGAEMQREQVESTASAMTEMNATVLEVAHNASRASEQSDTTRQKAAEGAELVNKVMSAINIVNLVGQKLQSNMQELGKQAESIGSVMNVISDIADQTNLLALNAAIEAARAGEAGRGFAVVADEVRKLAEKTMEATQEVGDSITAVQQSTRINIEEVNKSVESVAEANELANSSGHALAEILDLASANSMIVASIATAAEEQSATSEEISRAIDSVSKVIAETTDGMVQSSVAVQELARMAQELRRVMEELK